MRRTRMSPASEADRRAPAPAATRTPAAALAQPLQRTIGNQAVQRLLAARSGGRRLHRDFRSDFEGKASTPTPEQAPLVSGTVRVQAITPQSGEVTWVNAPYGIYSPGEIPQEYHDRIMESGKAFQWRNNGRFDMVSVQREMERLENAGELTVGDMLRLSRRAAGRMNIRIAMAKVGNDFRFVGYDMSQGEAGSAVHDGFVESESGSTKGVGRALFADRVTRALLNQASSMNLEVYTSDRTATFHAQVYAVAGRQGAPAEREHYQLTTTEMVRLAVAWNPKLTAAQVANLNALLARGGQVSPAEAEAALLRDAVLDVAGPAVEGLSIGPNGETLLTPEAQAKGAALEFGAQALLAKQISNLQSSEQAKALARLAELGPEIGRLLEQNYSVTITVEVEIPKTLNIAGAATQTDPSMIVYFRSMYIDQAYPILPKRAPGEPEQAGYHGLGEVDDKYGNPRRWDDPHEYTLDQQIRVQMGDSDPKGRDKPVRPTHRVVKRSETITPQTAASSLAPAQAAPRPAAAPPQPEPKLDPEAARKLAEAPTRVQLLTANVVQYKLAARVRDKLSADPLFRITGEPMGGASRALTRVVYWSDYDRPRAEKLADLLRAEGLPGARAELSGDGSRRPGSVQVDFGRDAEQ